MSYFSTKISKREQIARKRAQVAAYLESMKNNDIDEAIQDEHLQTEKEKEQRSMERAALLEEAGFLTRSLYRNCVRSIRILRAGNEKDENEFREREEEARLREVESTSHVFSMTPPVDRENELASRVAYYRAWARENFEQESDCLDADPWRERDTKRFIHFLKAGEEQRQWILKDYQFEDPYHNLFDRDRLERFETRAYKLIIGIYREQGWLLDSDIQRVGPSDGGDDDDDFFNDEEYDSGPNGNR